MNKILLCLMVALCVVSMSTMVAARAWYLVPTSPLTPADLYINWQCNDFCWSHGGDTDCFTCCTSSGGIFIEGQCANAE